MEDRGQQRQDRVSPASVSALPLHSGEGIVSDNYTDKVDGINAFVVKQACKFAKEHALKNGSISVGPIWFKTVGGANLPPELLFGVIKRLEESESSWPARKHVVACAAVCRSWRSMCKEIVRNPELCGKLTFPVSMKQPGSRDGTIQCFIKRDKSNLTYHLFLCLSPVKLT